MRLSAPTRQCFLFSRSSKLKVKRHSCASAIHYETRSYSQNVGDPFSPNRQKSIEHTHITGRSPLNPRNIQPRHVVAHLRTIFPPLEVPEDLALRMITHISWERGMENHNARLGFLGRRVLHAYLLLFLHECSLPSRSHLPPKNAPIPPTDRLRTSAFSRKSSNTSLPSTQSYDDISDKLLNTYILGEHVGAAWELERIMRWTPAVAELEKLREERPDTVLRSSGLYKVRGATVEGLVGGMFHQFGGTIAHRIFHTRILPHIYHFGLPLSMHEQVQEVCNRLGGQHASLSAVESRQRQPVSSKAKPDTPPVTKEEKIPPKSPLPSKDDPLPEADADTVDFIKVGREGQRERRRLSVMGTWTWSPSPSPNPDSFCVHVSKPPVSHAQCLLNFDIRKSRMRYYSQQLIST